MVDREGYLQNHDRMLETYGGTKTRTLRYLYEKKKSFLDFCSLVVTIFSKSKYLGDSNLKCKLLPCSIVDIVFS